MLRPGSERRRLARTLKTAYASCDVVLHGAYVSRHHARVFYRDGKWVLHDLRSTNGTLVNGVSVGRTELRPGDLILLGDEQLRIDWDETPETMSPLGGAGERLGVAERRLLGL